jgi:hypothetical protein
MSQNLGQSRSRALIAMPSRITIGLAYVLKPENATDVVVLIPENVTVSMLVQGES